MLLFGWRIKMQTVFSICIYIFIIAILLFIINNIVDFSGLGRVAGITLLIFLIVAILFAIIYPIKRYFVDDRNILILLDFSEDNTSLAKELNSNDNISNNEDYSIWSENHFGPMKVMLPLWWRNDKFLKKSNAFEKGCTYDFWGYEIFCCFCIDYSEVKTEAEYANNDGDEWRFSEESHITDYIAQKIYASNKYELGLGDVKSAMKFGVTYKNINGERYDYYKGEKKDIILEIFFRRVSDYIIVFAYGYKEDSSCEKMEDIIRVINTISMPDN